MRDIFGDKRIFLAEEKKGGEGKEGKYQREGKLLWSDGWKSNSFFMVGRET